jgi:transcriptional regulator
MYRPPHFRDDDAARLEAFVRTHPLAALVATSQGGLVGNHLPLQLVAEGSGQRFLRGHIARANELWRVLPDGSAVLAIFSGADRYITPAWYATKAVTGEVVPTWNYAVVHAHGAIRFVHDRDWLLQVVGGLTDEHERTRDNPWQVGDAPGPYVERMLSGIVGVEIAVSRLEGKFKASQNRTADDRRRIDAGLRDEGLAANERAELVRLEDIRTDGQPE